VVVEANDMDFELVAKPGLITLHVRDHGKALKTDRRQRQADLAQWQRKG
jgi:hypothetical protein